MRHVLEKNIAFSCSIICLFDIKRRIISEGSKKVQIRRQESWVVLFIFANLIEYSWEKMGGETGKVLLFIKRKTSAAFWVYKVSLGFFTEPSKS